jgi:hypothetical protein
VSPRLPLRQVVLLLGAEDALAGGELDDSLAGVLLRQLEDDKGLPAASGVNHGGVPVLPHHAYDRLVSSSLCGYSSAAISFPPLSQKVYFLGCIRGMGRFTKKNITSLLILCPSCIKIRDNLLDIWTVPKSTLFGTFLLSMP